MKTKRTLVLLLILMFFTEFMGTYTYPTTSVTIEDHDYDTYANDVALEAMVQDGGSSFAVDQYDSPETALPITMSPGGPFRTGSIEFQLNSSFEFIWFSFDINETSLVEIVVNPAVGETIDEERYEVYFDVIDPEFEFIGFQSTFDFDLPLFFGFPVAFTGNHYLSVGFFDLEDYFIDTGDSVSLNITINHFPPGEIRGNRDSRLYQSDALRQSQDIFDFIQKSGYYNFSNGVLDLPRSDPFTGLDPNDPKFYKGVGLSIYGIVRAGNLFAESEFKDDFERSQTLWRFLDLAFALFDFANDTLNVNADDTPNVYYVNPAPGDVATLTDNVYMLLGMGEIIYEGYRDPGLYRDINDQNRLDDLLAWTERIADSIYRGFENATIPGMYHEVLTDISGTPTQGDLVRLESMATLAEAFWQIGIIAGASDRSGNTSLIRQQIDKKLVLTGGNVTRINFINTIPGVGIGVEYYNATSGLVSSSSSVAGNLALTLHMSSIGQFENASVHTQNLLRFFEASDSDLLLSQTDLVNDPTALPKHITTLDNVMMVFLAQKLENNWNLINSDISRSWGIKALNHLDSLFDLLYDDLNGAFFGQYDNQANKINVDDNVVETNRFVANAFVPTVLSRIFPVQMLAIFDNEASVDNVATLELELSQIQLSDSLNWYDFLVTFEFQARVIIAEFDYDETIDINLADFFDPNFGGDLGSKFISFPYEPTTRGNYTIEIQLSVEGQPLLTREFELTAFGEAITDFSRERFDITDSTYTTSINFIDQDNKALSSLSVQGALGLPAEESQTQIGSPKYVRTGRTDSSGSLELTFNVKDLANDGLINLTEIFTGQDVPEFVHIPLFLNITNAESFNLRTRIYVVEVEIRLLRASLRVSPTNLEITQGTTDSFTFSVTALDQSQEPIANARLSYEVLEIPSISNSVFTDADGEGTITLRDSDLFQLSNLAVRANQFNTENEAVNATIAITITANLYQSRTISRSITIQPNDLIITANPVQVVTKEKTIFQSIVPPIEIEVATSDLFGRSVNSFVTIRWDDVQTNEFVDLDLEPFRIAPQTFTLDPSNLPPGEYTLLIIAQSEGITTTEEIVAETPDLALSQDGVSLPKITDRKITIERSTIEDVIISGVSVLAALVIARLWPYSYSIVYRLFGVTKSCPHCGETYRASSAVCSNCGRDVPSRKSKKEETPAEEAAK